MKIMALVTGKSRRSKNPVPCSSCSSHVSCDFHNMENTIFVFSEKKSINRKLKYFLMFASLFSTFGLIARVWQSALVRC